MLLLHPSIKAVVHEQIHQHGADHPVVFPAPPTGHPNRLQGRLVRAISIRVRVKQLLQSRFDVGLGHRLSDPVFDCRDSKRPHAASLLRYLYQPDGWRHIGAGTHPVPHPIEIAFQVRLEHLYAFAIDARRAPVGFDMPVRFPHHPLGYAKRFDRSRRFLPVAGLTYALGPDDVAASLQPHYRTFLTTISDSSTDLCLLSSLS